VALIPYTTLFRSNFIAKKIVKDMIREGIDMKDAMITIFGFTFKKNVTDVRNTRVYDMIKELESYGLNVQVTDPYAFKEEVTEEYDIQLVDSKDLKPTSAIVLAVPHDTY